MVKAYPVTHGQHHSLHSPSHLCSPVLLFIYLHCFSGLFTSCLLGKAGWHILTVSVWCFWHSLLQHAYCGTLHRALSTAHLPTHILLLNVAGHPPSTAGSPTASVPRVYHWQYERAGKDSWVKAQSWKKNWSSLKKYLIYSLILLHIYIDL